MCVCNVIQNHSITVVLRPGGRFLIRHCMEPILHVPLRRWNSLCTIAFVSLLLVVMVVVLML